MSFRQICPKLAIVLGWIYIASLSSFVEGGCKKRRATNVLPHEWSLNADTYAVSTFPKESFPKNFSWLDIDGVNMLVSSWNQHVRDCDPPSRL